jgi:hypothetical protein
MDHSSALAELLAARGFRRHAMTRTPVGHLLLVGHLDGQAIDILVDTGAASTIIDLEHCRARGIPLRDTGRLGGGAGGVTLPIHALADLPLTLEGCPLKTDGIFAIDMSHVNEGLRLRGAQQVHAVLGADVLRLHQAVIDYATLSLYLRH